MPPPVCRADALAETFHLRQAAHDGIPLRPILHRPPKRVRIHEAIRQASIGAMPIESFRHLLGTKGDNVGVMPAIAIYFRFRSNPSHQFLSATP